MRLECDPLILTKCSLAVVWSCWMNLIHLISSIILSHHNFINRRHDKNICIYISEEKFRHVSSKGHINMWDQQLLKTSHIWKVLFLPDADSSSKYWTKKIRWLWRGQLRGVDWFISTGYCQSSSREVKFLCFFYCLCISCSQHRKGFHYQENNEGRAALMTLFILLSLIFSINRLISL